MLARQEDGFVCESRERGIPTQEPSHQKQARLGGEHTCALSKSRDHADRQAPTHVHDKRCVRESRGAGGVKYVPTEQVSRDRTQESTAADQQKVAHGSFGKWCQKVPWTPNVIYALYSSQYPSNLAEYLDRSDLTRTL